MIRLQGFLLWGAIWASASNAFADQPPQTTAATLSCGSARLQAQTTSVAHVGPDDKIVWTAQKIELQSGPEKTGHLISVDGASVDSVPVAQGGLPAIVSSWQCLHGAHQEVILLWLSCNRSDKGGVCHGQTEWQILLDQRGRRLDSGYAPQDPRYELLSKKLGITVDGVHLDDAIGN